MTSLPWLIGLLALSGTVRGQDIRIGAEAITMTVQQERQRRRLRQKRELSGTVACTAFRLEGKGFDGISPYVCIVEEEGAQDENMVYAFGTTCPMDDTTADALGILEDGVPVTISHATKFAPVDVNALDYTIECTEGVSVIEKPPPPPVTMGLSRSRLGRIGAGSFFNMVRGTFPTIVVNVQTDDTTLPYDEDLQNLPARIFGSDTDVVNPTSIFKECSHGIVNIVPADSDNPVFTVRVPIQIDQPEADPVDVRVVENLVTKELASQLDLHHKLLIYCMPPKLAHNGDSAWESYSYVGGTRSVYNGRMCLFPAYTVRNIGHNLGLGPSLGKPGRSEEDGTCLMGGGGSDLTNHEGPLKCFNAAKSWQLGWYTGKELYINTSTDLPWHGAVATLDDYHKADPVNKEEFVVLQLDRNMYLMYNRIQGLTSGTQDFFNNLVLVSQEAGKNQPSTVIGASTALETRSFSLNTVTEAHFVSANGDTIVVEYCMFHPGDDISANTVEVSIHKQGELSQCQDDVTVLPTNPVIDPPVVEAPIGRTTDYDPTDPTIQTTDACPDNEFRFTLHLHTDNNPEETSWVFSSSDGSTTYSETAGSFTVPHQDQPFSMCFPSNDDYYFDILDAGGNGIEAPGSLTIYYNEVELTCTAGNLGSGKSFLIPQVRIGDGQPTCFGLVASIPAIETPTDPLPVDPPPSDPQDQVDIPAQTDGTDQGTDGSSVPDPTDPAIQPSDPCNTGEWRFTVHLTTDADPGETSWTLKSGDGTKVAESQVFGLSNTIHHYSKCFPEGMVYHFDVFDSHEDGLNAPGGFSVYHNQHLVREADGDFQRMDRTVLRGQCDENLMELKISTDYFGSENAFEVKDTFDNGATYTYEQTGLERNARYYELLCLRDGCFAFLMTDGSDDGFCCDHSAGWSISHNSQELFSSDFDTAVQETVVFGVNCPQVSSHVSKTVGAETSAAKVATYETHVNNIQSAKQQN